MDYDFRLFRCGAEMRKEPGRCAQTHPAVNAAWLASIILAGLIATSIASAQTNDPAKRFVHLGKDGKLVYDSDTRGNRIPDFSYCGYRVGAAIPDAPVCATVSSKKGDNGSRIQTAINYVAQLEPNANGMRGVVLL